MSKFKPQNFNDLLALILVFLIPALWVIQGFGIITLPTEVTGALIVTWSLFLQFYYRKAQSEDK